MATKEETIIKTTMELIAEGGFENFSTRKLAAKADCSEGLINKYFKSKDNLIKVTLDDAWKQIEQEQKESTLRMSSLTDPDECDREFVKEFIKLGLKLRIPVTYYLKVMTSQYSDLAADFYSKVTAGWLEGVSSRKVARVANDKYDDIIRDENAIFTCFISLLTVYGEAILAGKIKETEESYEMIYKLIFSGLLSVFHEV